MIYLLYIAKPKPLSFNALIELLDARNMPLTCRRFAEKLDYLRSAGFVKVFPTGDPTELSNAEQARLITKYCDQEGDGGDNYFAVLTIQGVNFQEGDSKVDGITRVN
jgi:hypothetical protein